MEPPCVVLLFFYCTFTTCTSYMFFIRVSLTRSGGGVHRRANFASAELVLCSACAHQLMPGLETCLRARRSQVRCSSSGISALTSPTAEHKGSRLFLS